MAVASPPRFLAPLPVAPVLAPARPRFALIGGHTPGFLVRRDDSPHGDIDIACEACHTPNAWVPLREDLAFDHDRDTPFALTGRHEQANCRGCHLDLRFDQPDVAPDACASCHLDVHRGQLGADCQQCHS
ncbi:MAG TPA: hypothetical protein VD962_01170, partial [Rubricoccaceae bacterium]|nr:hypothetical protein [Rubricoccaceae bacterium]